MGLSRSNSPEPPRTLFVLLEQHAEKRPDAVALDDCTRQLTFGELLQGTVALAEGLRQEGVKRGDRLGYLGRNSIAWFELLFAAACIGAVAVPISWRLSDEEIADIASDAALKLLFVEEGCEQTGLLDRSTLRTLSRSGDGLAPWRRGGSGTEAHAASPADVVLQIYTSGTTGRPKGVMLSHRNLLDQRFRDREAGLPWARWSDDDVSLVSMPVAHVSGTGWGLYGLIYGARSLIVRDFVPDDILLLFEQENISKLFVVPAALQLLVETQRQRKVRHRLRDILYGGAPISQPLLQAVRSEFPCRLVQLYGMTESSGAAVALRPDDHRSDDPALLRSAGRPLPGVEIAVSDVDKGVVSPTGEGEVLIRGSGVMAGYWNKPLESSEAIDADGWLHTGDIGTIAEDGLLTVIDRLKDMIITGGENVYPAEIEHHLREHHAVADVAVAGLPDDRWGEAVCAFVVLSEGAALNRAELREWAKQRMAAYKVPARLKIVDELPRNNNGKIIRRELRRIWAEPANWSLDEAG